MSLFIESLTIYLEIDDKINLDIKRKPLLHDRFFKNFCQNYSTFSYRLCELSIRLDDDVFEFSSSPCLR